MSERLSEAAFLALPLAVGDPPPPSGHMSAYFDAAGAMWLIEPAPEGLVRRLVCAPSLAPD